jgi:hypothetical protein
MKTPFIFNVGWAVQAMFIVLRCLDKIEWPWFKVFIPIEIYIGIIFIYAIIKGARAYEKNEQKRKQKIIDTIKNANIDDLK